MVQIIFYRQKCIGCNACFEAAPEQWAVSRKDGKCNLIGAIEKKGVFQLKIDDEDYDNNKIAAANCPVRVIKVNKF
ncbi:MAG: ferredoxin [Bacteroidia bacterium]